MSEFVGKLEPEEIVRRIQKDSGLEVDDVPNQTCWFLALPVVRRRVRQRLHKKLGAVLNKEELHKGT